MVMLGGGIALGGILMGGCALSDAYHREDLKVAVSKHHINLRWGRIPQAAMRLHPDLREGFIKDWEKQSTKLEIKDIEVVDILIHENKNVALVQMQITYLTKNSLQMNTYAATEKWRFIDERWTLVKSAELPPLN
jgi:hypothetical protein